MTADIDLDPKLPGGRVFDKAVIAPDTDPADLRHQHQGPSFTGVFDGNGHTIMHLTINGKDCLGLFGGLGPAAAVVDLGLEAVDLRATGDHIGSVAGENHGCITASYSTGAAAGRYYVGVLVGENIGCIVAGYSTGAVVTGEYCIGGLVGMNGGQIVASYSATGLITGRYCCAGGLVGGNIGYIAMCYSTSTIAGSPRLSGLVGYADGGSVISSFWDVETSRQSDSIGGVGLTTAEMQDANVYLAAGWDFVDEARNGTCDYWQISPGEYPRLRCGGGAGPVMPDGLGTAEQPYLIRDARDLGTIWAQPLAHYRQAASVGLSGTTWIAAVVPWFGGMFDGGGYSIHNLRIRGQGYLGLFGVLNARAMISNLGLDAVDVNGVGFRIGGLAGISSGSIARCHSTGSVAGTQYGIGGLTGWNSGSVTQSCSTATTSGHFQVGGLVGVNSDKGSITASYSTGAATGENQVGGLIGINHGKTAASYSTGAATGRHDVGGLVGYNSGDITASYSTGAVSGDSDVGGLVGDDGLIDKGAANSSVWDIQTSGQTKSRGGTGKTTAEMQTASTFIEVGWDFVGETANGTEDIWWIDEGKDYPYLSWEAGDETSP